MPSNHPLFKHGEEGGRQHVIRCVDLSFGQGIEGHLNACSRLPPQRGIVTTALYCAEERYCYKIKGNTQEGL